MSFVASILELAQAYAQKRNANVADVDVRVTLADGSEPYVFKGIDGLHQAQAHPDHVMLIGSQPRGGAIVVREQHVVKVEFGTGSGGRRAIGFHAETA